MSAIKGDFMGFTFNGVHSSELGLIRVSDNSRYAENLFPTIQDKTVQVPGADGTYYFGSFYTQRPINISVAFDDLSEDQFQRIKRIYGDKKVHDLIFDEAPYKVYKVKTTGTPNLKYVCFSKNMDEFDRDYQSNKQIKTKEDLYGVGARSPFGRIYKGEGQLNFICYTPFARSRYKYINQYTIQNVPEWGSMDSASANHVHYNLYDWMESARLKSSLNGKVLNGVNYTLDQINPEHLDHVAIYNPGNFPVHFNLTMLWPQGGTFLNTFTLNFKEKGSLTIGPIFKKGTDGGIRINGRLNLIEGIVGNIDNVIDNTPTGTIYNDCIKRGDFFKIPITEDIEFLQISPESGEQLSIPEKAEIQYDYLYY